MAGREEQLYLVSNTKFDDERVIWLNLCEIKFHKFSINSKFDALIFTSKNGVKALKFNGIKFSENIQIYAIGKACADEIRAQGYKNIFVAQNSHGDEFAREIATHLKGKSALYISAKDRVSNLPQILHENGVNLAHIIGYENRPKKASISQKPALNSVIIFTSPLNAKSFISNFGWDSSYQAICIGNSTAKILSKFTTPIISENQSIKACVDLAFACILRQKNI